ncbi:DUF971 family protein [Pseudoduganella lurida]|uniref:DUF971 family protein n=1 Tax=Pseudoduganella lurida TaxID=1036180 RepID=A0A562QYN0_9BURK|nr:DUF971 domain-containing protein [Pseudoduganella lurida]TWI61236.1 DUF971 family protein [Pseudoduganella lurida]
MANPTAITLHNQSRYLEIAFDDGATFNLPYEFLRVYSPSAAVQGHGPGQETLQVGKRDVGITDLEPVGQYALKPIFTDGHESGLYTWQYLYELGQNQDTLWKDYLARLFGAGFPGDTGRMPGTELPGAAAPHQGCGHHH